MMVGDAEKKTTKYEGYSDYQFVSQDIVRSINNATEALSVFESLPKSRHKLERFDEMKLRADVLDAAWMLRVELEHEREKGNFADKILTKWYGDENGDVDRERGYVEEFKVTNTNELPELGYFGDFAYTFRRAGWELGYLRAGRDNEEKSHGGSEDSQAYEMIKEMTK